MPNYIDKCESEIVTAQGGLVCWPILNLNHDLLLHSTRCYIKDVYFQISSNQDFYSQYISSNCFTTDY